VAEVVGAGDPASGVAGRADVPAAGALDVAGAPGVAGVAGVTGTVGVAAAVGAEAAGAKPAGAGVVGRVPVVVGDVAPAGAAEVGVAVADAVAGPAMAEAEAPGPAAYWLRVVRRSVEPDTPVPVAGAFVAVASEAAPGSDEPPGVVPFARSAVVPAGAAGAGVAGAAIVIAATIREVESETAPPTGAAEPSAELFAPGSLEPEADASASVPFCFPPFVEVCLLWPSASAVRAT
jgi:hypothetical protein